MLSSSVGAGIVVLLLLDHQEIDEGANDEHAKADQQRIDAEAATDRFDGRDRSRRRRTGLATTGGAASTTGRTQPGAGCIAAAAAAAPHSAAAGAAPLSALKAAQGSIC